MPPLVAGIAAILGGSAIAVFVATVAVNLVISFAITKVASMLAPSRSKSGGLRAQEVTINDSLSPRVMVYGEVKTSGTLTFLATSSKTNSVKNEYLWAVITIADHQVQSITDLWLDGLKIVDADISTATGLVSGGNPAWNGKLYIWKHLGTSLQTVDTMLGSAFASWNPAHKGVGVAYIVVRMERDPDVFPNGNPQNYFARVRGKRLYDPRLDSINGGTGSHRYYDPRTWAWSNNAALCAADYLTGGSTWYDWSPGNGAIPNPIPDAARRGMKELPSRIDWAQIAAAANECDDVLAISATLSEKRYLCNGILTTDLTHSENMARILSSMAGSAVYTGGMHRIFCGQYDTPTLSIGDNDLTGGYSVATSVGDNGVYNAVSAIYTDATRDYQSVTSYMRTTAVYETQDGGERKPVLLDLPMVSSETQAQRLCEIHNRQGRNQTVLTIKLGLNGFKLKTWDTFMYTNSELGYVNKVFRITHWQLDPLQPGVTIIARDEYATVYTDMSEGDFNEPSIPALGNQYELPDAPSSLKTTSLANAILVEYGPPTTVFANTKYEVQESSSPSMSSPTTVYQGADLQFTIGKTVTTDFYYRVRVTRSGQVSDWTPSVGGTSGRALTSSSGTPVFTALSAAASPGTATASVTISSATTNSVTVTAAGGTPGYTYAWVWNTGGSGITINSASSATTTFSATGLAVGETRSGDAKCTVTDTIPNTSAPHVAVTITRLSFSVTATNVTKFKSGFAGSGTVSSSGVSPATTPVGGTVPYTYAWTLSSVTSGPTPTIISSTLPNPSWSATVSDGTDSNTVWQVVVTDNSGATASTTIIVKLIWVNLS